MQPSRAERRAQKSYARTLRKRGGWIGWRRNIYKDGAVFRNGTHAVRMSLKDGGILHLEIETADGRTIAESVIKRIVGELVAPDAKYTRSPPTDLEDGNPAHTNLWVFTNNAH